MSWFKRILRTAPTAEAEGFSPSKLALKLATKKKTDYEPVIYKNALSGKTKKVLIACTEQHLMTMANGKQFVTGNHPVELFVPLLHLEQAGFDFEFYTPTGKPVAIEQWAMPADDVAVNDIYQRLQPQLAEPKALNQLTEGHMPDVTDIAALFIPGGHGAMLGLPEDAALGRLICHLHESERHILSICHGPAALLSATDAQGKFIFSGYSMAAFPDSMDKLTPNIGYMPGPMPWYFGEKLTEQGAKIVNKQAKGTCHQDRKLITGDSPDAANRFGKMATEALLADSAA